MKNLYISGSSGMVGSTLVKHFKSQDNYNVISTNRDQLDLLNRESVDTFFLDNKIDSMIIAAAKVGGIWANENFPQEFIYENLMIQNNLIDAAYKNNIKKLLFLGSSCIYPKQANQPIQENELLSGPLEETNEPYAIAKIAGIKLCESYNRQHNTDFRSLMPTNLYGPGDNFDYKKSHVIPALIRKFHDAKTQKKSHVSVWGSGEPRREFMHVNDLANACSFILNMPKEVYWKDISQTCSHINVGCGADISIKNLALMIKEIVNFEGEIEFDTSKKDGPLKKLLNINKMKDLGWSPSIQLDNGLESTYRWFQESQLKFRGQE